MSDLETLRAEADRLRDELVAHDLERDQLAQVKRDVDAVLFAAEEAAKQPTPDGPYRVTTHEGDVTITAPLIDLTASTAGGES